MATYYIQRMGHQDIETDPIEAIKKWWISWTLDGTTRCVLNGPIPGVGGAVITQPWAWYSNAKPDSRDEWRFNDIGFWAPTENEAMLYILYACIANGDAAETNFIHDHPKPAHWTRRHAYDDIHYIPGTWSPVIV